VNIITTTTVCPKDEEIFLTSQYAITILAMIFAATVATRTKIPHTMILVSFGIAISFFGLTNCSCSIKTSRIKFLGLNPNHR